MTYLLIAFFALQEFLKNNPISTTTISTTTKRISSTSTLTPSVGLSSIASTARVTSTTFTTSTIGLSTNRRTTSIRRTRTAKPRVTTNLTPTSIEKKPSGIIQKISKTIASTTSTEKTTGIISITTQSRFTATSGTPTSFKTTRAAKTSTTSTSTTTSTSRTSKDTTLTTTTISTARTSTDTTRNYSFSTITSTKHKTDNIYLTTKPRFRPTPTSFKITPAAQTSRTSTSVSTTITTRRRRSSFSTIISTEITTTSTTPISTAISTTSRRRPDSETSTKTITTPKTSTTTSSETTIARIIFAMEDHFCDNFDCIISMEPAEECFDYIKTMGDINCHLFCQLDNCTKVPTTDTFCTVYTCWPLSTTTSTTSTTSISSTSSYSTPVPDHDIQIIIGSCLGSVIAIVFIGLILFLGISLYKRQQIESIVDHNEGNTDHHFVVTTPLHSSSEDLDNDNGFDFETRSSIFHQPDLKLLEEAQLLIDQDQARTGSCSSKLHEPHDPTQGKQFEMSTFKKRMPISSNGFGTTVC